MNAVCIIDTSIFVNLLKVPGKNQHESQVTSEYKKYSELNVSFILPMATIIETGNHIAQNGDGNTRRKTAQRFCTVVKGAIEGEAPYKPSEFASVHEILSWLGEFPDLAGKNKSSKKTGEGTSFGDLSIIKEFERCVARFSNYDVFIWSLDDDLKHRHHKPAKSF